MSMPRFTADASLCTLDRTYQGAVSVRSGAIIQLAVHFPFFDDYNRCGCWDEYSHCTYICLSIDSRVDGECMRNCRTYLADCYAYCNYRRLTLPPSVVRPLGR